MADRSIKDKLVARRGFTTRKKFLAKLAETFSKEALAALSLQKTTMAYAFGEIVNGFYFSLNIDAVRPTEQQSLCATLFQSELGHAIRWTLPFEPQLAPEPLKVEDVVTVYEGQQANADAVALESIMTIPHSTTKSIDEMQPLTNSSVGLNSGKIV